MPRASGRRRATRASELPYIIRARAWPPTPTGITSAREAPAARRGARARRQPGARGSPVLRSIPRRCARTPPPRAPRRAAGAMRRPPRRRLRSPRRAPRRRTTDQPSSQSSTSWSRSERFATRPRPAANAAADAPSHATRAKTQPQGRRTQPASSITRPRRPGARDHRARPEQRQLTQREARLVKLARRDFPNPRSPTDSSYQSGQSNPTSTEQCKNSGSTTGATSDSPSQSGQPSPRAAERRRCLHSDRAPILATANGCGAPHIVRRASPSDARGGFEPSPASTLPRRFTSVRPEPR